MLTSRSQRWRQRRSSFVDDEALIDPREYAVDVLPHDQARGFIADHHYLNRYPAAQLAVGLFGPGAARRPELAGVIVFGVPASAGVITRHSGFVDPRRGCVLQRLLCLPSVAGNGESFFTARAFRLLRREKPAIEAVVSFSDPQFGHCGTVYAALSGAYRGRTRPRTVLRIAGETISDRTLSKIRNLERGHGGAIDQLVRLGATPPSPGQHPAQWLAACRASGTLSPHRQSALFTYCSSSPAARAKPAEPSRGSPIRSSPTSCAANSHAPQFHANRTPASSTSNLEGPDMLDQAMRTAAENAAAEMLRDLVGADYSDTMLRVATDHMLSFQRVQPGITDAMTRAALGRLFDIAASDTGQSARVARFLMAWWNGPELGDFPIADLFGVDTAIADDIAIVVTWLGRHPGAVYPDAFGRRDDMQRVVERWGVVEPA